MDRIIARMKKSTRRENKKTPFPRLDRRYAAKHFNYDAALSSSSSSSSADDLSISTSSSLMTRSPEFPNLSSFRINGGSDSKIERFYRSIGVSSPDDLGISMDAWEACMKRSSSDGTDRYNSFDFDSHKFLAQDFSEEAVVSGDTELLPPSESKEIENFSNLENSVEVDDGPVEKTRSIERSQTILVKSRGYLVSNDVVAIGGGGIKGVRPLVLEPPSAIKQPTIDDLQGSSWDFITHTGPKSETIKWAGSSSLSSGNGYDEDEVEEKKVEIEMETADEACSFTTNEGGDSSSTVSNTSPIYPSVSIITSWQKGQLLGRGSFGSVYEGISGDGDFFAVKEVSLLDQGSQAQESIQQLEKEIALLSRLQHPNIVRYRGTAKDESNLYIFLELVKGSLLKLYQTYHLMDSHVSVYTRQILDGLKYLHDTGFIHRDIKCANILVDTSGVVKLADFGLAKVSKLNDIKSSKGSPFWMAPEVINRKRTDGYGSSADIWSLGCTVLEMLTGQIPYCDLENPVQALFRIGRGVLPEIPDTISPDARDFILKCVKVNPEQRPTAAELLNHPFVRRPLPFLDSVSGSELRSVSPLLLRQG